MGERRSEGVRSLVADAADVASDSDCRRPPPLATHSIFVAFSVWAGQQSESAAAMEFGGSKKEEVRRKKGRGSKKEKVVSTARAIADCRPALLDGQ